MDLVINNTAIITGDGKTFHPKGQIGISGGKIAAVCSGSDTLPLTDTPVLDAAGATSFPGVINSHAHGCTFGPAMPSGSTPFRPQEVRYFRNRHLLSGTTTLLNVCGLGLPGDVFDPSGAPHPLRVFSTTAHSPSSMAAAFDIDGSGLQPSHLTISVEGAVAQGAVALGEGGGGQTLGGGAQDYAFVPRAIAEVTGVRVDARGAKRLKEVLLGRNLQDRQAWPNAEFIALCNELNLLEDASAGRVAEAITASVRKPMRNALLGLGELAELSARTGLPAILHNALPSAHYILALARAYPSARLIAAHSNHSSFLPEEAVTNARLLRECGVTIDVSTLDCISTLWRNNAENLDALISEGLVNTLTTDFAGGHWDDILEAVHRMVVRGQLSAPEALAMATGNVASIFGAFDDAGRIEVGKRADVAIADSLNLSRVRHVVIGGQLVVQDGAVVQSARTLA